MIKDPGSWQDSKGVGGLGVYLQCIRNTYSDADLTEHQVSTSRSPWSWKRIHRSIGWRKEAKKKRRVRRTRSTHGYGSAESRKRSSHLGESIRREGKNLRLPDVNTVWMEWEPQRWSLVQSYVPQTETQVHQNAWRLAAGAWKLESNSGQRLLLTTGRWPKGMRRRKSVTGNAFGRRVVSHGGRMLLLSHMQVWSHYYSLFLPTHWWQQLGSRERPSERVALWTCDVLSIREEPARKVLWAPAARI